MEMSSSQLYVDGMGLDGMGLDGMGLDGMEISVGTDSKSTALRC